MTATVWCVADTEALAAGIETDNPDAIELQVGYGYIKHPRKTGLVLGPLVMASAHELAHAYRLQAGHSFDLIEHAASEGVAMYAEQAIGAELGVRQVAEYDIAVASKLSLAQVSHMRRQLIDDNAQFTLAQAMDPDSPELVVLHDGWFEFDDIGAGLPNGYLLGMHGVFSLMSEGVDFSEIAQMPAAQILGIE